tara:strand:- start:113 stop:277 length:165 start_codon:yes stop_codon:yes gene_type:complete
MHKQDILKKMKIIKSKKYPNSEYISNYGLYLPSFVGLKKKELDKVISTVNKIIK